MHDTSVLTAPGLTASGRPRVGDLDESLVRTDTLLECIVALVRRPLCLLRALLALRYGKAKLKQELAAAAALDPALLPYNQALLRYLREQHAAGRVLVLATGADRKTAEAVAQHLNLLDVVLASDGCTNLTGRAKLAAIRECLNEAPFAYIGNSHADLSVWCEAAAGICVNAHPRVARAAAQATTIEHSIARETARLKALARALRPHQWVKNLLVFVPLITAHAFGNFAAWADALVIFVAFCCAASGIYLINDLSDLAADRQHPRKSQRPFASGALPLHVGLTVAPLLLMVGFGLSAAVSALPILLLYTASSCAYSFWLKSRPLVDVFTLAALYGLRLVAGGVATGYNVSLWLLAFSSFLFLSLAMVKRVAELTTLHGREKRDAPGRGYLAADWQIIQTMGVASSFASALVLALYVQSELPSVDGRPTLSWVIVPLVLFWKCRIWLSTSRGWMTDDPIVFAARDWVSWLFAIGCAGALLLDQVFRDLNLIFLK